MIAAVAFRFESLPLLFGVTAIVCAPLALIAFSIWHHDHRKS